jgi:hypothetical protein
MHSKCPEIRGISEFEVDVLKLLPDVLQQEVGFDAMPYYLHVPATESLLGIKQPETHTQWQGH